MTRNVHGERRDDRLEAGYRELAIRKDAVKMVEATVQLKGYHQGKSEEMQNRGVERGL